MIFLSLSKPKPRLLTSIAIALYFQPPSLHATMDDFGGRTDDDLFADEFEPVAEGQQPAPDETHQLPPDASSLVQQAAQAQSQTEAPPATAAPPASSQPASTAPPSAQTAPRGLKQSRHAHPKATPPPKGPRKQQQQAATEPTSTPAVAPIEPTTSDNATTSASTTTLTSSEANATEVKDDPAQQPTPATAPAAAAPATNAKPDREARLKSGANPRTKLTDEELAAKMERMRILSAEKTRRFEQAQRDESEHAVAYARGMEEARRRRAEEAEKRRRGEEERRRMDDERQKNRERKLAAMGSRKEAGGWDLGRDHEEDEGGERRFRSAYGGVRGARSAGLAGSRFAGGGDDQDGKLELDGRGEFGGVRGGRGRGRGRGGRGRGGFFDDRAEEGRSHGNGYNGTSRAPAAQKPPAVDDFPALPPAKKMDAQAKASLPPLEALSPQVGGWADEVADMDEKQGA